MERAQHRSPSPQPPVRPLFPFIDALRGVAAVVILVHHLFTYVPRADAKLAAVPLVHELVWWYFGLASQVFLVISGFVGGVSLARAPRGQSTTRPVHARAARRPASRRPAARR
ncbi:MAG: heparan-alpha-glucosaminide N-acetyltransferase domain-containing protein [Planctomycetia bacterium]